MQTSSMPAGCCAPCSSNRSSTRSSTLRQVAPFCKPQPEAYLLALKLTRETLPQNCLVIDDSPRNLSTAAALGFPTVLVGPAQPEPGILYTIPSLKELARVVASS